MLKTALVTGASGGIGKAVVEKLAQEGYQIYAQYFRNIEPLKEAMKLYDQIIPVYADLSSESGTEQLLENIPSSIDALIFANGISHYGLIQDVLMEDYQKIIQLHLTSPFFITQKVVSGMIRKQKGSILFISSIWGQTGASCEALYSMAKGGQISFVKALAKELAPSNIRVNAVAPGMIDTSMNDRFSPEELEDIKNSIPLERNGKPEEVANVVLFLISEQASYITGQVISVNGGWYC
ncbi:elongation factor P 5-aminopentanone reductase [Aeribacillus sp. FSL K6-8210]|uniref:elongation factor P 5-aminopentanone reductase n=1 Tax=unclassified Aeribacillus TaxID=2640495 RepID=UPI00403F6463